MRALITILDNTTETSMPFNEFVLYRANHYNDERQILIICGKKGELPKVEIPKNLKIIYASRKLPKIRKTIRQAIAKCKEQGVPYGIHMHQVQSGFLAEVAMLGTGFRKKSLFTVHSTFSGYKFHNKFLSFFNTFFARYVTCVSNASYADYPKMIKGIKKDRMRALQNGVDTERIDGILRERDFINAGPDETGRNSETVNFIYVARLIPIKNHSFLLDVLKQCDEKIRFIFVGEENSEKTISKKAHETGLDERITFTGLIPRNEVFVKLKEADYYISSSTLEGLPVSVLEAMYCGLPCVLSDIVQHKEVAGDGTVILPFDVNAWAKELNRLANLPKEEREKSGNAVREHVLKHFSLAGMHKEYDKIYDLLDVEKS
ncbi:MAG: glycosyltransferase [Lachnospiraceae bacterium]|nr:glycosyltransferase [Lachnospiraceae bacterium]